MQIALTETQAQAMIEHARTESPREACGLIAGRRGQATQIVQIANIAANPQHQYYMDEAALGKALVGFERQGVALLGIYHSHPNGDPIPSPTDIRHAAYPGTPYLIIGLKQPHTPQMAAWVIRAGRVDPVNICIGDQSPEPPPHSDLSRPQQIAIVTSAILAFVVMILLSLALLPPAPVIPR
ncbi:MAG: M67 family metallopeptidase [Chloroflexi bacterium]|nr:M67 family metallopeptidase [Chloroflexota bacterium]